jgi:hypothetical protein
VIWRVSATTLLMQWRPSQGLTVTSQTVSAHIIWRISHHTEDCITGDKMWYDVCQLLRCLCSDGRLRDWQWRHRPCLLTLYEGYHITWKTVASGLDLDVFYVEMKWNENEMKNCLFQQAKLGPHGPFLHLTCL